jgi:hypothetical protein
MNMARTAFLTGSVFWVAASLGGCHAASGRTGETRSAAAPSPRWTTFEDPSERAFSLAVPAGWKIQGGLRRRSAVEVHYGVTATSPDGRITLFLGDENLPTFTVPSPYLIMAGYGPGRWYSPGFGQQLLVEPYAPGAAFAQAWGVQRFRSLCPDLRQTSRTPLPQAARDMDMAYAAGGVRTHLDAGEADFTGSVGSTPMVGYVLAATTLAQTPGSAVWQVEYLGAFWAPAWDRAEAADLLAHEAASFRLSPAWLEATHQAEASISRTVTATGDAVARSIHAGFEHQMAAEARAHQGAVDAIRGVHRYTDPSDPGRTYELDNRYDSWIVGDPDHPEPYPGDTPPARGGRLLVRVQQ